MSLEKILERIKMIEEDNFEVKKNNLQEEISVSDIKTIFQQKNTSLANSVVDSGEGFRDAIDAANRKLGDRNRVKGVDDNSEEFILKAIYKLMEKSNAKISDIDYIQMAPIYGFKTSGARKILKNNDLIILTYTSSSFTNLKKIEIKRGAVDITYFTKLYQELNANLTTILAKKITMGTDIITIEF